MSVTWLLASQNTRKVLELRALLSPFGIEFRTPADFPGHPPLREDENTFLGNARAKAWILANFSKMVTLADDSGLEVAALGGAPGVFSARYANLAADENSSDEANNAKLLRELESLPAAKRDAAYRCVLVLADPLRNREWNFAGACAGRIGFEKRGQGGFGYDPLFLLAGENRTMAEVPLAEKNQLSHRARALRKLVEALPEILERK